MLIILTTYIFEEEFNVKPNQVDEETKTKIKSTLIYFQVQNMIYKAVSRFLWELIGEVTYDSDVVSIEKRYEI